MAHSSSAETSLPPPHSSLSQAVMPCSDSTERETRISALRILGFCRERGEVLCGAFFFFPFRWFSLLAEARRAFLDLWLFFWDVQLLSGPGHQHNCPGSPHVSRWAWTAGPSPGETETD